VLIHRDKERRGIDEDVIEKLQHLMSRLTNSVMCRKIIYIRKKNLRFKEKRRN